MFQCPACGSREIYRVAGGCMGELYRCKECGYFGAFIVEVDEDRSPGRQRGP
ncbi:MAG TPA: transposase [Methanoregulaceae archaeon]|nr:MAG: transposase [Methanolinea sp.]HON81343.1 transposase [Methanoregulaceae archaeon]HPD09793.1 transposase [Methanoregulaceae archaeon]HRT14486.1 transposase [Methanoregulaceae archaeon]HRU30057.1 transposase [Methanoregulaceae archaeon]